MNERIGPMYVPDEQEENYTGEKPYSHVLGSIVDIESRKLVQSTYLKAEEVLKTNRDKLIKVCLHKGDDTARSFLDMRPAKAASMPSLTLRETLNRCLLLQMAEALLEKETLNYDEVVALIGPPTFESAKRKIDPIEFENSMKNIETEVPSVP